MRAGLGMLLVTFDMLRVASEAFLQKSTHIFTPFDFYDFLCLRFRGFDTKEMLNLVHSTSDVFHWDPDKTSTLRRNPLALATMWSVHVGVTAWRYLKLSDPCVDSGTTDTFLCFRMCIGLLLDSVTPLLVKLSSGMAPSQAEILVRSQARWPTCLRLAFSPRALLANDFSSSIADMLHTRVLSEPSEWRGLRVMQQPRVEQFAMLVKLLCFSRTWVTVRLGKKAELFVQTLINTLLVNLSLTQPTHGLLARCTYYALSGMFDAAMPAIRNPFSRMQLFIECELYDNPLERTSVCVSELEREFARQIDVTERRRDSKRHKKKKTLKISRLPAPPTLFGAADVRYTGPRMHGFADDIADDLPDVNDVVPNFDLFVGADDDEFSDGSMDRKRDREDDDEEDEGIDDFVSMSVDGEDNDNENDDDDGESTNEGGESDEGDDLQQPANFMLHATGAPAPTPLDIRLDPSMMVNRMDLNNPCPLSQLANPLLGVYGYGAALCRAYSADAPNVATFASSRFEQSAILAQTHTVSALDAVPAMTFAQVIALDQRIVRLMVQTNNVTMFVVPTPLTQDMLVRWRESLYTLGSTSRLFLHHSEHWTMCKMLRAVPITGWPWILRAFGMDSRTAEAMVLRIGRAQRIELSWMRQASGYPFQDEHVDRDFLMSPMITSESPLTTIAVGRSLVLFMLETVNTLMVRHPKAFDEHLREAHLLRRGLNEFPARTGLMHFCAACRDAVGLRYAGETRKRDDSQRQVARVRLRWPWELEMHPSHETPYCGVKTHRHPEKFKLAPDYLPGMKLFGGPFQQLFDKDGNLYDHIAIAKGQTSHEQKQNNAVTDMPDRNSAFDHIRNRPGEQESTCGSNSGRDARTAGKDMLCYAFPLTVLSAVNHTYVNHIAMGICLHCGRAVQIVGSGAKLPTCQHAGVTRCAAAPSRQTIHTHSKMCRMCGADCSHGNAIVNMWSADTGTWFRVKVCLHCNTSAYLIEPKKHVNRATMHTHSHPNTMK